MPVMHSNDLKEFVDPLYDIMQNAYQHGLLTSDPTAQAVIENSVKDRFSEIVEVMPFFAGLIVQAAIATFNEVARDPHLAKDQAVDNVCRLLLREDNNYLVTASSKDQSDTSGNKRMKF